MPNIPKCTKYKKCKNNPSRSYTGSEPSPKGYGWCASQEKIGRKRKGTNQKMWIVRKTKVSKRWFLCSSSSSSSSSSSLKCKKQLQKQPEFKVIKNKRKVRQLSNGTSKIGEIELVPSKLVKVFGQPMKSDEYKTSGEYTFQHKDGQGITLYDWKSTTLYRQDKEANLPSVKQFWSSNQPQEFSIGGQKLRHSPLLPSIPPLVTVKPGKILGGFKSNTKKLVQSFKTWITRTIK